MNSASSAAVLVFDLSYCVHTLTTRGNREWPESRIYFKIFEKTQYLMNTLYLWGKDSEKTQFFGTIIKLSINNICIYLFRLFINLLFNCRGDEEIEKMSNPMCDIFPTIVSCNVKTGGTGCSGKKWFFCFTIHCNPSLAYINVRDLRSSRRNASVHSLLLVGYFLYN